MLKSYKTELNLNNKECTILNQCSGLARFVFNWSLTDRIQRYEKGLTSNKFEQESRFNSLKNDLFPWVHNFSSTIATGEFKHCDLAFQNFFQRVKRGEKPGFPKFKSKKSGVKSFTLRGHINIESKRIKLPRIGWIRLKEHDYLPIDGVKILSATISNHASHWFVSLHVEQPDKICPTTPHKGAIGVDLGIKVLATCSNGKVFENPKTLNKYEDRLSHLQREFYRRVKGSKNRAKTKLKIAKLHYRISNTRHHAIHEITHYLTAIAKPEVIVLEDLNIQGMVQNRHLSKAIMDAAWGEMRRQLGYKTAWEGEKLLTADRFYASSKLCSVCGSLKPLLKLSERVYFCETCGSIKDRDFNASKNLEALAH